MNFLKTGVISGTVSLIFLAATPALAQSYGYGGEYGTYTPAPSYSYSNYNSYGSHNSPMIVQMGTRSPGISSYMNMPSRMSDVMRGGNMQNTYQPQYSQYQNQYSAPQYSQQYPQYSYQTPQSYSMPSYNPSQYSSYSYPQYDSSYAPYSSYYTTYPQQNMGYTGDTDALGSQLCNWQGYGRSDCSFNPHQWVYDPYSGTWY